MIPSGLGRFLMSAAVAGLAVSCATGGKDKPPERVDPADQIVFRPLSFLSNLRYGQGRYPSLYSPESFSVWVDSEVTRLKREKAVEDGENVDDFLDAAVPLISENFFVFECHLESMFADASIAYDSVGLRNMDVYLLSPDGTRVRPIQRVVGSTADEELRGALKLFHRVIFLVFPKRDILVGAPTIGKRSPGVRLVLEGYNSAYYFEWLAAPLPAVGEPRRRRPTASEARSALKVGFTQLYSKLRGLGRFFR